MRFCNHQVASRLLIGAVLLLSACGEKEAAPSVNQDIPFTPEGVLDIYRADSTLITRLVIELAETDQEQAQGLMYRRSLPERGGMLFTGTEPVMKSFWMRNTPLPLDILFLDEHLGVVNIVKRTTPFSDEHILSTAPAQYVLEVRAGVTDRFGIDSTAYVTWERREFNEETP